MMKNGKHTPKTTFKTRRPKSQKNEISEKEDLSVEFSSFTYAYSDERS
jgi:hypothetical protein